MHYNVLILKLEKAEQTAFMTQALFSLLDVIFYNTFSEVISGR